MGGSAAGTRKGRGQPSAIVPQPLHVAEETATRAEPSTENEIAGVAVAMPAGLRVKDKSFWYDMIQLNRKQPCVCAKGDCKRTAECVKCVLHEQLTDSARLSDKESTRNAVRTMMLEFKERMDLNEKDVNKDL